MTPAGLRTRDPRPHCAEVTTQQWQGRAGGRKGGVTVQCHRCARSGPRGREATASQSVRFGEWDGWLEFLDGDERAVLAEPSPEDSRPVRREGPRPDPASRWGLPSPAGRGGPRLLVRLWDTELPSAPHDGALLPCSVRSALSGREARKHASRTLRNDRISREWRLVGICGDRHP